MLALVTGGRLQPETVTSTLAPLDDAPRVLGEHFRSGGIKAILTAPGS